MTVKFAGPSHEWFPEELFGVTRRHDLAREEEGAAEPHSPISAHQRRNGVNQDCISFNYLITELWVWCYRRCKSTPSVM